MEQKYIVRCNRAGVFFGEIEKVNDNQVLMRNVRKLWHWRGACAVEQLSQDGTARPNDCDFTVYVPSMTVLDPIQIIPCTEASAKSIMSVREWRYER